MSADHLSRILLGTFVTILVLVALVIISKAVRNTFFPSENQEGRSEAMTELLLLQARLEEKVAKDAAAGAGAEGETVTGGQGVEGDTEALP